MTVYSFSRFVLAIAIVAVLGGPAVAQPPPVGYRVYSWGYYDRLPFATPLGSTYSYTEGRPVMSYVDPWGRVVDMPLRPKVFYNPSPFLTVEGYYNPVSITMMPETARLRPPTVLVRPAPPISYQYDPARRPPPPAAEPPIPRARDLDATPAPQLPPPVTVPPTPTAPPVTTIPPARTAPPAATGPAVPKLPTLPKGPPVPGIAPDLGPAPSTGPPPEKKPG